jgi:DNA-binding NtrC family response regulator
MACPSASVLLVDDSEAICLVVSVMLDLQGYRVRVARTYHDGRQQALTNKFHLILIDANLGPDSGIKLAEELLSVNPGRKIILVTGMPDLPDLSCQPLAKRLPVLFKPFSREELISKVRDVVGEVAA